MAESQLGMVADEWMAAVLEHRPEAIEEWANALRSRFGNRQVAVCLEQRKGPLIYALTKYEHLTLFPVNPMWDQRYPNKARVLAVDGESGSRAYPFPEMDEFGDRVVINDVFEDRPVLVVYEAEHRMAIPYEASISGTTLTFDGTTAP